MGLDMAAPAANLIAMYERWGYHVVDQADWRPHTNYASVVMRKRSGTRINADPWRDPMRISATVASSAAGHDVTVRTGDSSQSLPIARKTTGPGSSVNGGEFLMLALATCYCNDLFREAQRLAIPIDGAEVEASADFEGIGLAATNITYRAKVHGPASAEQVQRLLRETDAVAEVHNTVRAGVPVQLVQD